MSAHCSKGQILAPLYTGTNIITASSSSKRTLLQVLEDLEGQGGTTPTTASNEQPSLPFPDLTSVAALVSAIRHEKDALRFEFAGLRTRSHAGLMSVGELEKELETYEVRLKQQDEVVGELEKNGRFMFRGCLENSLNSITNNYI